MSTVPITDRTRVRRLSERQVTEREALYAALDEALVAHVGFVRKGAPVVIPMGFGRDGDDLLLHGSTGAGITLGAATGMPVSICVTLLDGLVFARSLFDSSMNYRSVVVHGTATVVSAEQKEYALLVIAEHLMPGRPAEVRGMTRRELAATQVLRVPLAEASLKVRAYGATEGADDGEDHTQWAGVLPLTLRAGDPQPTPLTSSATPLPPSVRSWTRG